MQFFQMLLLSPCEFKFAFSKKKYLHSLELERLLPPKCVLVSLPPLSIQEEDLQNLTNIISWVCNLFPLLLLIVNY